MIFGVLDSEYTRSLVRFDQAIKRREACAVLIKAVQQGPLRSKTIAPWQIRSQLLYTYQVMRRRIWVSNMFCANKNDVFGPHTCSATAALSTGSVSSRLLISLGGSMISSEPTSRCWRDRRSSCCSLCWVTADTSASTAGEDGVQASEEELELELSQ